MSTNRCCNWLFTLNNYTAEEEAFLKALGDDYIKYMIYGHEIAPTTGTPHLQGFMQLVKKQRRTALTKKFGKRYSFRSMSQRATPLQNIEYCSKDATDIYQFGQPQLQGTNKSQLCKAISECQTWWDVLQIEHIESHMTYAREVWNNKPIAPQEGVVLRPWQQHIVDLVSQPADDRTIVWVYDPKGNKGKTFLAKFLMTNYGAFYCSPGKSTDIFYAYNNQEVIVYDIPRSVDEEFCNWGAIEKLKDGIVFSGKYQAGTKIRKNNAHVIIFSNRLPLEGKFSEDRIKIIDLSDQPGNILNYIQVNEERAERV